MIDLEKARKHARIQEEESKARTPKATTQGREERPETDRTQADRTLKLIPFRRLMENPEPPRWLIEDILPEKGLVEFFGASGSFKSFIVMDMGYCVATGTEWHGHPVSRGNVVYFAGEGHHGLKWRGIALERHYKKPPDGFFVSTRPLDMSDETTMREAGEKLKAIGDVKLVIIDTLHRNAGGADEDSAKDWGKILKLIDEHLVPHADVIAWVHHTGHAEAKRSRGTSSRYAALDASYLVERDAGTMGVRLECTKMKDAPEPDPRFFEMETVETDYVNEKTQMPITSLVPKRTEGPVDREQSRPLSRRQEDMLRALRIAIEKHGRELPDEIKEREGIVEGRGCTLEQWREEAYKVIDVDSDDDQKKREAKKKAFQRAREGLIERDMAAFYDGWCFVPQDCTKRRRTGQVGTQGNNG